MPAWDEEQRRFVLRFVSAIFLSWLIGLVPHFVFPHINFSTLTYSAILVVWIITVRERVIFPRIRNLLILGASFLVALFLLRFLRWDVLTEQDTAGRLLWYAYYIPFTFVPLISLSISLNVESDQRQEAPRWTLGLGAASVLLILLVLTNDWHHLAFRFETGSFFGEVSISYGPLYYGIVIWCITLTLSSFLILLKRCGTSASREFWYIPVIIGGFAGLLILLYGLVGGSPALYGWKLYNLQEVFAFLFIGLWEGCFQIGLIPTNSGYATLYENASLGSFISTPEGTIAYQTKKALIPTPKQIEASFSSDVLLTPDIRLHHTPIRKNESYVFWEDDLSTIHQLYAELKEALDQVNTENSLLEYENEIKEQQTYYETHNRLYDEIAGSIKPQLETIKALLTSEPSTEPDNLAEIAVLGAYIKRKANLALIAENQSRIELSDLYYSIKESLDYLSLSKVTGDVELNSHGDVSSSLIIHFYDVFQAIIQEVLHRTSYLMIHLAAEPLFSMGMMLDTELSDSFLEGLHFQKTETAQNLPEDSSHWIDDHNVHLSFRYQDAVSFLTFSVAREVDS